MQQAVHTNKKEDTLKVKTLELSDALTRHIDKGQFHSVKGVEEAPSENIISEVAIGMRKKTKTCSDMSLQAKLMIAH